jgi:hypothetical protein
VKLKNSIKHEKTNQLKEYEFDKATNKNLKAAATKKTDLR